MLYIILILFILFTLYPIIFILYFFVSILYFMILRIFISYCTYIYIKLNITLLHTELYFLIWLIGLVGRVFATGPGDMGSIPGCIIPKTLKMVLDISLLNTQQYKVRIKGKVEQSRERVALSPRPRCSSYWKGSLLFALDYGCQLYIYITLYYLIFISYHNSYITLHYIIFILYHIMSYFYYVKFDDRPPFKVGASFCFSTHITHSSVNFTWFTLYNHQRFYDRPPFKLGASFCD